MAHMPLARPRARRPYGVPQHPSDPVTLPPSPRQVRLLHPGYPDEHAILLVLPALDDPNGIHHGTALDACAILAGNRWDGYLTLDREAAQRVSTVDLDLSLGRAKHTTSMFLETKVTLLGLISDILTDVCGDYAIVPTFAEWSFPHDSLPARWRRDPTFNEYSTRRCRLSNAASLLEDTHIIPQNQSDEKWLNENGMAVYGPIHGNTNTIRFKVDIHQHFDRKPKFAIVPKYNTMVAHVFNSQSIEAREAIKLYHNVPVVIEEQSSQLLLGRFAWTLFHLLEPFLKKGVKRRLLRKTENGHVVREEDATSCTQAWLSARPRSGSPSKRLRNEPAGAQEAHDSEIEGMSEQPPGRKRRRSSPIYTLPLSQSTERDWHRSGSELSESMESKVLENLKS